MVEVRRLLLTLLLALFAAPSALAQVQEPGGMPADPMAPGAEMAEPVEVPDVAWVRLAHFSPNAGDLSVELAPTAEDVTFSGEGFDSVGYQSMTEYMEVPAGNYAVSTQAEDMAVEEEFSFDRGNHYTLAVLGLLPPPEVQQQPEDEGEGEGGGIGGFFRNLFGQGDSGDALALDFNLIEDDVTRVATEGETLVRIVHAAPGTERVDIAVSGEQGTLADVTFGNASRYVGVEGGVENLEVRLSGSQAATLSIADLNLQPGNINTIYVVGTPVEQAPLTVLGSSIAPVEVGSAVAEDVAVQSWSGETAGGGTGDEGQDDANQEGDDAAQDGAEGDDAAGDDAEGAGAAQDGAEGDAAADPATDEGQDDANQEGAPADESEGGDGAEAGPGGEEPAQPEGEAEQAQ